MTSLARTSWRAIVGVTLTGCGGDAGDGGASDGGGDGGQATAGSGGAGAGGSGGAGAGGAGASGSGGLEGSGGTAQSALSGPTPANDPDFIASVSSAAHLTVWRRYKDSAEGPDSTCPAVVDGSCALFTCAAGTGFEGAPRVDGFGEDFLDAGIVTATFEREGTTYSTEVTTSDDVAVASGLFEPSSGMLLGGEVITYALSGDDIPAFTAMIPFPQVLTTTNSGTVGATGFTVEVDRTQDFTLTWDGGAPGVLYQVTGGMETGPSLLYCEFDSTLGAGTIPAALLGQITPTTRLRTITASAIRTNIGGYDISLAAGRGTVSESGEGIELRVF